MHPEAKDIMNHGLRFLAKSPKEMPDPLPAFLRVHKTDFERSIDASGYKAEAQDFLTYLNIWLFKEDLKKGSPATTATIAEQCPTHYEIA